MFKGNHTFSAKADGVNSSSLLAFSAGLLLSLGLLLPVAAQELPQASTASELPRAIPVVPGEENIPLEPAIPMAKPVQAGDVEAEPGFDGLPLDPTLPIELKILSPKPKEIVGTQDVDIFFSLSNYHLMEGGNRLHIIVNNGSPLVKTDLASPLSLKNLSQGGYTIRAMVVRPDGTMIQQPGCFAIVHFYVRKKDFQNYTDPKLPYLTVNLPQSGEVDMDDKGRVCFDYLIHNPPTDGAACKILYKIEGFEGFIEQPVGPIYWSNLPPGRHKLVVELFDGQGQPVFGVFNRIERVFDVRKVLKALPFVPESSTGLPVEAPQ
jgi:hypothetical protein